MLTIRDYIGQLVDFELSVRQCRRKDDFGVHARGRSDSDEDDEDEGSGLKVNLNDPENRCPKDSQVMASEYYPVWSLVALSLFQYSIRFGVVKLVTMEST